MIRRLICSCGKLHNELPDCLVPQKHYASEVIENVVDEVSTPNDKTTEDYPCECTMKRWKDWLAKNIYQIEGILRTVGYSALGFTEELLKTKVSLLKSLREKSCGWLSSIHRIIYNSGHRLHQ